VSKPYDFGGVNLNAGEDSSGANPTSETPFCIAILGDFSGRANRGLTDPQSIGKRRAVLVDRDNFDEVLAKFKPELRLPLGGGGSLHLNFSEIDDFHPDRIYQSLDAFAKLRALRSRLQDRSTFREAADELGLGRKEPASAAQPQPEAVASRPPSAVSLASGSLLDDMIEQTEVRAELERPKRETDAVRAFAQRVAAESLIATPDPRQPEILAVMDRAIGALMQAVLHNPDFQALEAIWRATFLLVRQLETGSQLKLCLFDISKQELAADLQSSPDVRGTGTYRLLVEKSVETAGADVWSVLVGNYTFGAEKNDWAVLSRMARIAHRAGAAFLAHASSKVLGCASLASSPHPRDWGQVPDAAAWSEFRHSAEAAAVGLGLPRFLLRLPYGQKTSAAEAFAFEELSDPIAHEDYLWGNPAFVLALLLGQSFAQSGWEMRVGEAVGMSGLPLHTYSKNGESHCQACAEVLLTEEAVERMLDEGLIPLVSFKNRDSVRVARFQSATDPQRRLSGRWV